MIAVLLKRKLTGIRNEIASLEGWEIIKRGVFTAVGIAMLVGLYFGFFRVLRYLEGISMIGPLLSWKLTAMAFLTTFSMIVISGLITSMTTLYCSYDLKFLFSAPISVRTLFIDKALETSFYASWTLAAVILPYVLALGRVKGCGAGFYLSFLGLMVPFVLMGAAFGIMFSMLIMYAFPSSKTRDAVWVLGSVSLAMVYVMIRFAQPEKLLHPDALEAVAQYLQFLQAPTAEYLPSWWITKAMMSFSSGRWSVFLSCAGLLFLSAGAVYGLMVYLSGRLYMKGFSGAQEGRRFEGGLTGCFEHRLALKGLRFTSFLALYWKDRKLFIRDARYWSQIVLILALIAVYLFSIRQLPLDTPDLKSLVSFLNIGIAGFVVSAIGLRFTFPAVSLEGKSWWIVKSAPVPVKNMMLEKLVFSALPSMLLGGVLVVWSNRILHADMFVSALSVSTIMLCSVVLSAMGVGLGAVFPKFNIENIHQIESSSGGFVYMACCLGYLGATIAIEAWPVQMHFAERFGRHGAWNWTAVAWCAAALAVLNAAAAIVPWKIGLKTLENYEGS